MLETSMLSSGFWSMAMAFAMFARNPLNGLLYHAERSTYADIHPLATYNCFETNDGVFVQLLGLEMGASSCMSITGMLEGIPLDRL